jgi:hypothetical protein
VYQDSINRMPPNKVTQIVLTALQNGIIVGYFD